MTTGNEPKFLSKVRFLNQEQVHPSLKGKEFCLLGFDKSAFALIEWDRRGGYGFEYFSGNVNDWLCELKSEPDKKEAV